MRLSLVSIVESVQDEKFNEYLTIDKSNEEFEKFMEEYVPFVVKKVMLAPGNLHTLKVCSGVSPEFAYLARKNGFKAIYVDNGSHQFNFVKTKESTWKVDLSYIQFICSDFMWPDDARTEEEGEKAFRDMMNIKLKISKNPYEAVKIEKLPRDFWEKNRLDQRLPSDYTGGMWEKVTEMLDYFFEKSQKNPRYFEDGVLRALRKWKYEADMTDAWEEK